MAVIEGAERRIVGGVDTHKDLHVAAVVDEQDRVIGTRSFATTRQGYRQMLAWMRSFGELQRIGIESTGSYGAGLLRFMQQAGIAVLEVTTPDKQDRRRRGKNDDLDAQNAAHAAFAGQRTVTPRSRDGMIESLRVLMACRKTAVSARRVALQMIHNTIVCAPDGLRDQLRSLTRMQLVRTLAAWRPDLTAYRDVDSAYRIGLKSLARRYLELHDEIADLDAMIAAIVDELAPEPRRPQFDRPHRSCAASPYGRRQSGKIAVGGQLRIAVRRQPGSGVVGKDHPASAQPRRRSRRQQRAAHHRHRTLTNRPEDQGLRCSSNRRRAFQTRRHSSPEALHRPRGLHAHHAAPQGNQRHANRRLTNRRASAARNTPPQAYREAAARHGLSARWAGAAIPTTTPRPRAS